MRMVGQPLTELCGFSPQAFDTLGGLLVQIGFDRQGVVLGDQQRQLGTAEDDHLGAALRE